MEARIPSPVDDLPARAAAGEPAALEELARAWWPRIRRWAWLQLADDALAEDASQEALERLVDAIGSYDPDRPFGPWLRTLVRHVCSRVGVREARHRHDPLDTGHAARLDLEADVARRRLTRRALEAFGALSPREREVLGMCAVEGMSAAEAGRSLEIAPSTARVLLHRARRKVRAAVGEEP